MESSVALSANAEHFKLTAKVDQLGSDLPLDICFLSNDRHAYARVPEDAVVDVSAAEVKMVDQHHGTQDASVFCSDSMLT